MHELIAICRALPQVSLYTYNALPHTHLGSMTCWDILLLLGLASQTSFCWILVTRFIG